MNPTQAAVKLPPSPKSRYNMSMVFWMTLYIMAVFGCVTVIKTQHPTGIMLYALALIPSLPIGGSILAFLHFYNVVDEYIRALMTKRFVYATGITLFLCTLWGFLEAFANAPHIELYFVYALFWFLYGSTCFTVRQSQ